MAHKRELLKIACWDDQIRWMQSIQRGEWHLHHALDAETGLRISHRNGMALSSVSLGPLLARRLLRALQAAPPCPVDALQARDIVAAWRDGVAPPAAYADWAHTVRALVAQTLEADDAA